MSTSPKYHTGQWIESITDPTIYGEITAENAWYARNEAQTGSDFLCWAYSIKGRERAVQGREILEPDAREIAPKPMPAHIEQWGTPSVTTWIDEKE